MPSPEVDQIDKASSGFLVAVVAAFWELAALVVVVFVLNQVKVMVVVTIIVLVVAVTVAIAAKQSVTFIHSAAAAFTAIGSCDESDSLQDFPRTTLHCARGEVFQYSSAFLSICPSPHCDVPGEKYPSISQYLSIPHCQSQERSSISEFLPPFAIFS